MAVVTSHDAKLLPDKSLSKSDQEGLILKSAGGGGDQSQEPGKSLLSQEGDEGGVTLKSAGGGGDQAHKIELLPGKLPSERKVEEVVIRHTRQNYLANLSSERKVISRSSLPEAVVIKHMRQDSY